MKKTEEITKIFFPSNEAVEDVEKEQIKRDPLSSDLLSVCAFSVCTCCMRNSAWLCMDNGKKNPNMQGLSNLVDHCSRLKTITKYEY